MIRGEPVPLANSKIHDKMDTDCIDLDPEGITKGTGLSPSDDFFEVMINKGAEKAELPFKSFNDFNSFMDEKMEKLDLDGMIEKALGSVLPKIRQQERKSKVVNRMFSDCEDRLQKLREDLQSDVFKKTEVPSGSDSDDDIQFVETTYTKAKTKTKTTPVKSNPTVQPIMTQPTQPQYKLIINNSTGQAILQPIGGASMLSQKEMAALLQQTNLSGQITQVQQAPQQAAAAGPPAALTQHVHIRKQQFPLAQTQPQQLAQQPAQHPSAVRALQRPALQYNQLQHKQIELAVGMKLYGKKNNEIWYKGTLLDIQNKDHPAEERRYKIKFDGKGMKILNGKNIALADPPASVLPVGSRLIALYKDEESAPSFYAGIAAESPSFRNNRRYLVFFDDGYAQYCESQEVRKVVEQSRNVWEDVHPDSQEFIKKYLHQYPEIEMALLHRWTAKVDEADASLVKMYFDADKRTEWIYRGSTRLEPLYTELANAEVSKQGGKGARRQHPTVTKSHKAPYVEYLRNYEDEVQIVDEVVPPQPVLQQCRQQNTQQFIRMPQPHTNHPRSLIIQAGKQPMITDAMRKKAPTARKSSGQPQPILPKPVFQKNRDDEAFGSRMARKTFPSSANRVKYKPHACGRKCLKDAVDDPTKFKGSNPLIMPMLCGWERQIGKQGNTGKRVVFYRTPCGRRLRNIGETDRFLMATDSQLTIDLFCFDPQLHTHSEFVPIKTFCDIKDLSYGKESVPISCVNGIDRQYPDYVEYSNQRMPAKGVSLNTEKDFLCGCDCTDGCRDPNKCACIQMTVATKRAALGSGGRLDHEVGYRYRRLQEQLITGIYECNPQCACDKRCHNRVAQNDLSMRLQVFKTEKRGWGLRCLDDIPAGGFICIYAGQLLTEQGANEDGQQYGDEYLAELDYIEVVEKLKEGYESDVEDPDKDTYSSASSVNQPPDEDDLGRESDSDSNYSAQHPGRRRRRRAVKTKPMNSQQRTQNWIRNLPIIQPAPTRMPQGQRQFAFGQPQPTVRSILAQTRPTTNIRPARSAGDEAIIISDEEDFMQLDGQTDRMMDTHMRDIDRVSRLGNIFKYENADETEADNVVSMDSDEEYGYVSLPQYDGPPDDPENDDNAENEGELEDSIIAVSDLETELPTSVDVQEEPESTGGEVDEEGIGNLTITEPTSLNLADVPDAEDEEDEDEAAIRFKRTTRSQTSRFQNLPDPKAAAKQKLADDKQKAEETGSSKAISFREMCDEDFCYVMDAKSMGNIGRYLNHSCAPNVFVQNVFVDTHDLRFPWVAFFAAQYIRAGTELTWDYNYDVGSVPGKVLYCYCGAAECRGRLL